MANDPRPVSTIALGLLALSTLTACKSEQEELVEQLARQGRSQVPSAAVGAGTDPASGLPLGYPDNLPLVPGGEAIGGGVEPGVIRTATLYYDRKTPAEFLTALRALLAERNQRVVVDFETQSGSRQMRVDTGSGFANLVIAPSGAGVRFDVTMMEPRQP